MKYEFTGETKEFTPWFDKSKSIVVQRIRYTETGELGGFIENESNLSQDGDCHIDEETVVFGNAKVYGNANVTESEIGGSSQIYDNATVRGYTLGNTKIYGNAVVDNVEESLIDGDTQIYDNAHVESMGVHGITNTKIHDNAQVAGAFGIENADIYENAEISYPTYVSGSKIHGNAIIFNRAEIGYGVEICGNSRVGRGSISGSIKFEDSTFDVGLKSIGLDTADDEDIKVNICGVAIDDVIEALNIYTVSFTKSTTINKDTVLSEFLSYASNKKDFALAFVKQDGNNVKYMPDDFKNDKDVALAAVSQNGNSVRYLSKEMRSDKDVAKAAITQNEGASRYVSKTVLNGLNDFTDGVDGIKIPDGDETI